ncbi:MAG: EAL domain-containing protein [Panacagrimonas sp.]
MNPVSAVVLVVSPFEESAKRVEVHLRSAGHKTRAIWISERADLETQVQRNPPDLVFASDHAASVPLVAVVETCRRFAPGVPVLSLSTHLSTGNAGDALATGARDRVADGDAESLAHLERVFVREYRSGRDARDLAQARTQLAAFESRNAQWVADTVDPVAHIHEGILTQVNPAFATLLGYDDVEALTSVPLMDVIAPEHQAAMREHLKALNKGRDDGKPLNCELLRHDAARLAVIARLSLREAGSEQVVEMLIRPRSTQAAGMESLERSAFLAALDAPAEAGQRCAGFFAVIDHFAQLEERVGYLDAGQLANQVGERLRQQLGAKDGVFRFSTREFGLLVSNPDPLAFQPQATSLVRDLGAHIFSTPEHEAQLSLSISVYPLGGDDVGAKVIAELVRQARKLSADGGSRIVMLGPTARASANEREDQRKADMVRWALRENQLRLAYQTIASLEGDNRQHFDVLLRLIDDKGVEVPAADFIGAAEKAGLMRAIDRWVVDRALRVITARKRSSQGSMLFVKLSEDSLRDSENFLAWFQELTKGRLFGKDEICFEIPEPALQNHLRKASLLVKVFRDVGASIAIEHFGASDNAAQLFDHLPVHFVKFHKTFTLRFGDKDVQSKMSALMEAAKARQIRTIVSHVEDANSMARMWQMGVNFIQGFHIQEPEIVVLS